MQPTVLKAMTLAQKFHQGQLRDESRKPYIVHPERVYLRLQQMFPTDVTLLAAAWGHDLIEDTGITEAIIERELGLDVLNLIKEVTNPSKNYPQLSRKDRKEMDLQHIKGISNKAKILKLADRRDNLTDSLESERLDWLTKYYQIHKLYKRVYRYTLPPTSYSKTNLRKVKWNSISDI